LISTFYIRRKSDDPAAEILFNRLKTEGHPSLREVWMERVVRLEGLNEAQSDRLTPLLCNPVSETISHRTALEEAKGPIFEIGYQRAVTDPETPSILHGAESLKVPGLEWARIAHRYQFIGLTEDEAFEIVRHYLFNPQVQVIIKKDEIWETLKPQGQAGPVEHVSLIGVSRDELIQMSENRRLFMSVEQMEALQKIEERLDRPFTDAELEMFAQTWSDHCFHTTWKSLGLLKKLQDATNALNHPLVLSSFEDNAGVMKFYDGWALTLKGETHNSPTAVSPYGGIMTKHGGVIRDTLGCGHGAKPIGGSTVMGLGDPYLKWEDVPVGALHPRTILMESIRGTADYTNPMGIPMMFPAYRFHPGYTGKCFALGHSVGFIPSHRAQKGKPKTGDVAILIGGKTGRDGLHGATVSSGSMTSETAVVDAAHVQIGQPIEERKFMEAIPVLRDQDCLHAVTDLGAGGLSSAAGEMGADTGIFINLARVPLKTEGMRPWEIWISESQERMLLCVPLEKIDFAFRILDDYESPGVIVGKFRDDKRCHIVYQEVENLNPRSLPTDKEFSGQSVVDLEMPDLRKACPMPDIQVSRPKSKANSIHVPEPENADQILDAAKRVLSHLNCCDQSPAGAQFDSTVQGVTVTGPYGGINGRMPNDVWISAPVYGKPFGAVASLAFNPFYSDIDPAGLAKLMIIESITKLIVSGVDRKDIVLCDNFYTPRVTPEIAWDLVQMVETCADLSVRFGTPFISGKDSSSGTFIGQDGRRIDVPPTLCVMALGRMEDVRSLTPKPLQKAGNRLFLIGPVSDELGGSVYWDTLGHRGGRIPNPEIEDVEASWRTVRILQSNGRIVSGSAVGEGGLFRRLFEMALGGNWTVRLDLKSLMEKTGQSRMDHLLFAEMIGAVIVEVPTDSIGEVSSLDNAVAIGEVITGNAIRIKWNNHMHELPMRELTAAWEKPFMEVAR
jgi:phosphoribosylformylglycinamidine synthase II